MTCFEPRHGYWKAECSFQDAPTAGSAENPPGSLITCTWRSEDTELVHLLWDLLDLPESRGHGCGYQWHPTSADIPWFSRRFPAVATEAACSHMLSQYRHHGLPHQAVKYAHGLLERIHLVQTQKESRSHKQHNPFHPLPVPLSLPRAVGKARPISATLFHPSGPDALFSRPFLVPEPPVSKGLQNSLNLNGWRRKN